MARLGWVGLGDIGLPMMVRLKEAGHEVCAWGRSPARLAAAEAAGAQLVPSAAELGRTCEAVFLCVTDADAVEDVVFGPQGVATASGAGTYVVDHSTIHPARTRDMAARLRAQERGRWVDAPVSGGAVGARAGTLAVMAGGEPEDLDIPCDMGRVLQTPMPLTSLVTSLYRHHQVMQEKCGADSPVGLLDLFLRTGQNVRARF